MKVEVLQYKTFYVGHSDLRGQLYLSYRDDNYNYCDIRYAEMKLGLGRSHPRVSLDEASVVAEPYVKGIFGVEGVPKMRIYGVIFSPRRATPTEVYGGLEIKFGNDVEQIGTLIINNQVFGTGTYGVNKSAREQVSYLHNNFQRLFDHQVVINSYVF